MVFDTSTQATPSSPNLAPRIVGKSDRFSSIDDSKYIMRFLVVFSHCQKFSAEYSALGTEY